LWWSPDPRGVITPQSLHLSRSLRRALRHTRFTVTCTTAFEAVMDGCAEREEGTWLTSEMKAAYLELKNRGSALSFEVWDGEDLVGGLYGVLVGRLYAAESKFHRRTDASKIALVCAVTHLFSRGLGLFDVQFETAHLKTLGVFEMSRSTYLAQLPEVCSQELSGSLGEGETQTGNLLPQVLTLLGLT
jgi:leucyl/phenylalanyl-tRNA---protein transferase